MVPQPGSTVKGMPNAVPRRNEKREGTPCGIPSLRMRGAGPFAPGRGYSKRLTPVMTTMSAGASVWMPWGLVFSFWILSTVSMPSMTWPNTQ